MSSGTITKSSSTVGSSTTPVYLNSGTITSTGYDLSTFGTTSLTANQSTLVSKLASATYYRVVRYLTEITTSSITIAAGSTGTATGGVTVDMDANGLGSFTATDVNGNNVYYFSSVLIALSWCTAPSPTITYTSDTISLSVSLQNNTTSSHTCAAKYRIIAYCSSTAIAQGLV